ncbi:MAG: polysaccharide biosynthesis/export family protein [Gammaproteobacteria bacterium]|nr:polysaccharide biosynthesis/export family protein [Gammaproteobacteria bacterium]NNF48469.1 sugar ABC transporter substrate-binding protein [Woeseiaceae bacterium]
MRLITIIRAAALAIAILTASACGSSGGMLVDECPTPPFASEEYIIGPGDVLQIVVWRNAELSAEVPVRPDGKVSTPLIDDMVASGKTPSQLSANMEEVLAEFLRTPEVSVMVAQQGAANQVQVIGEVVAPQALSYREGLRVLDIIIASGGLSEFAAGNRARVVRPTALGQVNCSVRARDLVDGDMSQNILIYPGDVLVVPETRF